MGWPKAQTRVLLTVDRTADMRVDQRDSLMVARSAGQMVHLTVWSWDGSLVAPTTGKKVGYLVDSMADKMADWSESTKEVQKVVTSVHRSVTP